MKPFRSRGPSGLIGEEAASDLLAISAASGAGTEDGRADVDGVCPWHSALSGELKSLLFCCRC